MAIFKEEEVSGGLLHTHFEKKLMIKQGRHDGTISNTTHDMRGDQPGREGSSTRTEEDLRVQRKTS